MSVLDQDEINDAIEQGAQVGIGVIKVMANDPTLTDHMAKIAMNYYKSLLGVGFTESQAMSIVSNFKPSK